jgi:hypothetical protein
MSVSGLHRLAKNLMKRWRTTRRLAAETEKGMARRGPLAGLALLAFLLLPAADCGGQESLPVWFLSPPGGRLVQAFASSEEEARRDRARVLATYERSLVWGDFQSFYDTAIDADQWTNSDYYYYVDELSVAEVLARLNVLDEMLVSVYPRMSHYLLGVEREQKPSLKKVNNASLSMPDWARKSGYKFEGNLYGAGSCAIAGALPGVWTKAEEIAVFDLLTYQSVRMGSITVATSGQGADGLVHMEIVKLKYRMEGLRVVGRWLDSTGSMAYVLVSAPVGELGEHMNKKSNKAMVALLFAIALPPCFAQSLWIMQEIAEIDGFSELDDILALKFKDSVSGAPIPGVRVELARKSYRADSSGLVELPIQLVKGVDDDDIAFSASAQGYVTLEDKMRVRLGSVVSKRFLMTKGFQLNQARFVLEWERKPADLDAHLVGPGFHVSYQKMRSAPGDASLDRDARQGYGPETLTLLNIRNDATYALSVENYSKESHRLNIKVTVYFDNRVHRVLFYPEVRQNSLTILTIERGQILYYER